MSDRQACIQYFSEQQEIRNTDVDADEIVHNFIDIAHEFKKEGDTEGAKYFYKANSLINDAKHYGGVYFDNTTNQATPFDPTLDK